MLIAERITAVLATLATIGFFVFIPEEAFS